MRDALYTNDIDPIHSAICRGGAGTRVRALPTFLHSGTLSVVRTHESILRFSNWFQGWVSGTGGGITVLSTGGACIAPSGVQKERMQPHEIFVVPLALCSGGDSVTQGAAGAASLSIDFYHFVRKQGFPFPPPPPPLPLSFPSPPFSSLPPLRSLDPKGLKISQCTPLFQVIYRLRSGLQPFQTTLNPYRM